MTDLLKASSHFLMALPDLCTEFDTMDHVILLECLHTTTEQTLHLIGLSATF